MARRWFYRQSEATCTTATMPRDARRGRMGIIRRCLACHTDVSATSRNVRAKKENCLPCHMLRHLLPLPQIYRPSYPHLSTTVIDDWLAFLFRLRFRLSSIRQAVRIGRKRFRGDNFVNWNRHAQSTVRRRQRFWSSKRCSDPRCGFLRRNASIKSVSSLARRSFRSHARPARVDTFGADLRGALLPNPGSQPGAATSPRTCCHQKAYSSAWRSWSMSSAFARVSVFPGSPVVCARAHAAHRVFHRRLHRAFFSLQARFLQISGGLELP